MHAPDVTRAFEWWRCWSLRYDLAFDWLGVAYVLANDVFTSLVGVLMEKKMDAKELNSWGLMYYNSLFSIPVMYLYIYSMTDEVR